MKHRMIGLIILIFSFLLYACNFYTSGKSRVEIFENIELLTPTNGAILSNNIPTLVWRCENADQYEVWVDGKCLAKVNGDRNRVVSFPLSFGKHDWYVAAIQGQDIRISPLYTFFIDDTPVGNIPEGALLLREDWLIKSSETVSYDGEKISSQPINIETWHRTSIPVTVLSALVRNGIYPNPYVGKNNLMIPDCNDSFNEKYDLLQYSHIKGKNPWKKPYWFRKTFRMNESLHKDHIWLHLDEVNYKADVWLNGRQLGDSSTVKGMERRFRFEITDIIRFDSTNMVAIAVYPPDHPGEPSPPPLTITDHPGRNMGADGRISLDYTKWDAIGWDWQPAVRDRDTGIIDDIYITATGSVEIQELYLTSNLSLKEPVYADIMLSLNLVNHSGDYRRGTLAGEIVALGYNDPPLYFELPVQLEPGENKKIELTPENIKQLHLKNPRLWWPVDLGRPDRYRINLGYSGDDGATHRLKETFGIRKIETYIGKNERVYKINGEDIYIKAGNWVLDMMLNWSANRYINEVNLAAQAHINLLRVWGPTGVPPEIFFRAADSLGIMIWQDFLNDFWGTFKNNPALKPPADLFKKCTIDIIKRLRNHPSIVIWCGGNEGPNQFEEMIINEILPQADPGGDRHYLKNSLADGLHGSGPYHTIRPVEYFKHENVSGFNSEVGPSGVPVETSMYEFLPELGKIWDQDKFPMYSDWGYHDANERGKWDNRKFSFYDSLVRTDYGAPETTDIAGVADYLMKCQLINYDVYRAATEAVNQNLWKASSGFALWKINAGWPSLTWQLFDWYLYPNAGYYAVQKSCEPLHIQLNRDSLTVSVINSHLTDYTGLDLLAEILDFDMKQSWHKKLKVDIRGNKTWQSDWAVDLPDKQPCFLRLSLKQGGIKLSENIYWLDKDNDFTGLFSMKQVSLEVESSIQTEGNRNCIRINVNNPTSTIAFMVQFKIIDSISGEEVQPAFYSRNFISLFPHSAGELSVRFDRVLLTGEPVVQWQGVNVEADTQLCKE